MKLVQRILALGWATTVLALQTCLAEQPRWTLSGETQVFADLNTCELKSVHRFLMNRTKLDLQPSKTLTLHKNSVFLIELLLPRKKDVLNFLDKEKTRPVREARVVIFFGAQEHPNITEFAVGPLPQPTYMRKLSSRPEKHHSWASRPMSRVEYGLLHQKLKIVMEPLRQFTLNITGYSLQDCNGECLVFTDVAPKDVESRYRQTWFILQLIVDYEFLQPTGLEILINHESLHTKHWTVEQVKYNGRLYKSTEELAKKYEKGEVDTVVFKYSLPRRNEDPPLFYMTPEEVPFGENRSHVVQPQGTQYTVKGNTVHYGDWSFSYLLRPSSGLQLLNVRFEYEPVAYEVSVQAIATLYQGKSPAGMYTKFMDVGWGLGPVTHELVPGIHCPDTATLLDAIHYYDDDDPVHYPKALCIFEKPTGTSARPRFNEFTRGFNSRADSEGHMLVLRTISTVYNFDYIWDFIFYSDGLLEAKMHATGVVHAHFYNSKGQRYAIHLHAPPQGNIHIHLAHYRIDLDVAGTKNSFKTLQLQPMLENIINPGSTRQVPTILKQKRHSHEMQAAFCLERPLPYYLLFDSPKKDFWGHRRSYRLVINSKVKQALLPSWQEWAVSWTRYPLVVTKYKESERHSTSFYNQNHPWDPPVVFENFLLDDDNIKDKDLVVWVTVSFQRIPLSKNVPKKARSKNPVGFLLWPFNFYGIKRHHAQRTQLSRL
ncbi:amiloride-sensitive amine oxidase [copper-containing]-like [Nannospalax galili]|uniref:amiloride-sensitive amine oxidase [copper-containing]-like n=1 Tax=Nannospalax galili TaxID=1026970 RepID=UPI00111C85D2|nr:amiloride-sensitive amine oxidase [copper-containing]-like [Nannospalax galili]